MLAVVAALPLRQMMMSRLFVLTSLEKLVLSCLLSPLAVLDN